MSLYHGAGRNEPSLTTGQLPALRRRRSELHTLMILALLAVLGNVLLVEAYVSSELAPDNAPQPAHPSEALPAAARTGGLTGPRPGTYRIPARGAAG